MSTDQDLIEEIKKRLADKYTAMELVELMDLPVETIIEEFFDMIPAFVIEELS